MVIEINALLINPILSFESANTSEIMHWIVNQTSDRSDTGPSSWSGHDRCFVDAISVSVYHEFTRPIYNRVELYSTASVYHLGLFRDEVTLQAVECMWDVDHI